MAAIPAAQSEGSLVERVRAYIERFETEASAIVAEEHYTQTVTSTLFRPHSETRSRVLRSDYVLVKPSDEGPWLGYRDVFEVDGKEVRERSARLMQILETTAPDSLARAERMALEGARFNLGPERTVNTPTMPMELLASRHKARIRLRATGRTDHGPSRAVLTFEERGRPTIVRTPEGVNVVASGEIVVRVADNAIMRARLVFRFDRRTARNAELTMQVSYADVPDIPVPMPLSLSEQFPIGTGSGSGDARYSHYRRFQTTARIR
ncbi:MAG: hypothetical protein M3R55_06600 [Acidobacteriota bacterium]|nr:hypothetical protein [Acidobacteriota bacterium]